MPRLSFVIPVLNEERGIAPLLQALRRFDPGAELLVVDGGSSDRTVAQALPLCDRLLTCPPGRARQMNLGGRAAMGDYLLFLHADTRPDFTREQLEAQLAGAPDWGFCRVRLSGERRAFRLIEWAMNQRSRLTAVATGDQLLFLRRQRFLQSGGFAEIPLMEDVEYSKRLRRLASPRVLPQRVIAGSNTGWRPRCCACGPCASPIFVVSAPPPSGAIITAGGVADDGPAPAIDPVRPRPRTGARENPHAASPLSRPGTGAASGTDAALLSAPGCRGPGAGGIVARPTIRRCGRAGLRRLLR